MAEGRRFGAIAVEAAFFQGIALALGLSWVVLVTHLVTVAGAGKIFVAFAIVNTAVAIFSFGLPHALAVAAPRFDSEGALVANGVLVSFICAILAAVAVQIALVLVWSDSDLVYRGFPLIPITTFALLQQIMAMSLLRAIGRFRTANFNSVTMMALFNFGLLALLAHGGGQPPSVVIAFLTVSAVVAWIVATMTLVGSARPRWRDVRQSSLRSLASFGGAVHLGNILKEIMYRSGLYIVQAMLGVAAAGQFGVVMRLIEALARFVDAVCLVLLPMNAKASNPDRKRTTLGLLRVSIPIMLVGVVITIAAASFVFEHALGPGYGVAAALMRLGVFAIVPLTAWKILANDLIARRLIAPYIASSLVGACAMILGNVVLLPLFGVAGAAVSLIAAYALSAGVLIGFVAIRLDYLPWRPLARRA